MATAVQIALRVAPLLGFDGAVKAALLFDGKQELAEGPVWWEDRLYWVNITAGELHRLDPVTQQHESMTLGGLVGAAAPCTDGRWILARDDGFAFFDWKTGEVTPICDPERHLPRNRFNDGKCDAHGRFWAGTLNLDAEPARCGLYVLDPTLACRTVLDGVNLSNGMAWSQDGRRFFYTDTETRGIDVFDFEMATGAVSNRRVLAEVPEGGGFPDGMTIDAAGNLWVALWGGAAIVCLDGETGRELARIEMPVSQPSSCTFGGPDLDELYVTSAWQGLPPERRPRQPSAGGIFRLKMPVRGRPADPFRVATPQSFCG